MKNKPARFVRQRRGKTIAGASACFAFVLLFFSSLASAGPRASMAEGLRFLPDNNIGIFHLNNARSTVGEVMAIVQKLGFGQAAGLGTKKMWTRMAKEMKLGKTPTNWREFFGALGLSGNPSASLAFLKEPASPIGFGMVASVSLSKPANMVRMLSYISRDIMRSKVSMCSFMCTGAVRKVRSNGHQGPVDIKMLLKAQPRFETSCGALVEHYKKQGQVVCASTYKERRALSNVIGAQFSRTKMHKGHLYQFAGISKMHIAMIGNFAVLGSSLALVKSALKRYASGKPSIHLAALARRARSNTHMQASMDYAGLMKIANSQNRKTLNRSPLMKNMKLFRQFESFSNTLTKGFGRMWFEVHGGRNGFEMTFKLNVNQNASPLVKQIMKLQPMSYASLAYVPRDAMFVMSANYMQTYFSMAQMFVKQAGINFPINALIGPWQQILGETMTLAGRLGPKRRPQIVMSLGLRKPNQFVAQINRLQQALGQKQGLFKTTKVNGLEIFHILIKPKQSNRTARLSMLRFPFQIAFVVSGKHLVFTAEVTPKQDLSFIKSLAQPKLRGPSILKNASFAGYLKKSGPTNMVAYMSFGVLKRVIQQFPLPRRVVMMVMPALSFLKDAYMAGGRDRSKRSQVGIGFLHFTR